jgi:hypothetical protein
MNLWKIGLLGVLLGSALAACNVNDASGPRMDVTLNPSPIAQYDFRTGSTPTLTPEPQAVILAPRPGVLPPTPVDDAAPPTPDEAASPVPDQAAQPTITPADDGSSEPVPASNFEEIQALSDNPTLVVSMEMEATCFLAGDFIPFSLNVTSLETQSIYFYRNGRWRLSINNSTLGPELSSLEPTIRDDFVDLQPSDTYIQEEEDLGGWVLSLGPNSGLPISPTGLGLPAGDYWVTFVYDNDQDGLREQPDGTFLIDRAAWRGTIVAREVRFTVVNDLSEC